MTEWLGKLGYKAAFWFMVGNELGPHFTRALQAGFDKLYGG